MVEIEFVLQPLNLL